MNIEYSGNDRVSRVAFRILSDRFDAVQLWLRRAVAPGDGQVEAVHQLRVSSRRAVAALKLFHELLPDSDCVALVQTLRTLRRAAGDARDLDVLIDRFAHSAAFPVQESLLRQVRDRRLASRIPLQNVYERLVGHGDLAVQFDSAIAAVKDSRHRSAQRKFHKWVRPALKKIVKSFLRAGRVPLDDAQALHRFRIRCKDLRYALEALVPSLPSRRMRQVLSRLKPLQLRLGHLNDAVSAITQLEKWEQLTEDNEERIDIRRLLDELRSEHVAARADFTQWWTAKRQRRLRRCVRDML